MKQLRGVVFWPTFILLIITIACNFIAPDWMNTQTNLIKTQLLDRFQTLFGYACLAFFLVLGVAFVSPLGAVRIGGEGAKPLFKPWTWFAIALGTTTAVGILFWASAEPIYHMTAPPKSLGIAPNSTESGRFALATLFMHWTLIPHAIYTLPALLFALAFFNEKKPFSIASCLSPFTVPGLDAAIDSISLYCLVVGMAASIATGVLSIAGGVEHLFGIKSGPASWVIIGLTITGMYVASVRSGLQKGIRLLSKFNSKLFAFLLLYFFIFGPTKYLVRESFFGGVEFIRTFWERSTFTAYAANDSWPRDWPVFYFANWLAWAPVTGTFLGRISYGYTVRSFILLFLAVLAAFGGIWIAIFGTVAVHMHLVQHLPMEQILTQKGAEGVMFFTMSQFPGAQVIIPIFLVGLFVSCVTAADSNSVAMAAMSAKGVDQENPDPPFRIKLTWGVLIGFLAMAMLFSQGLGGVKTMSILGGFPALFFEILCTLVLLWKVLVSFGVVVRERRPVGNNL